MDETFAGLTDVKELGVLSVVPKNMRIFFIKHLTMDIKFNNKNKIHM